MKIELYCFALSKKSAFGQTLCFYYLFRTSKNFIPDLALISFSNQPSTQNSKCICATTIRLYLAIREIVTLISTLAGYNVCVLTTHNKA